MGAKCLCGHILKPTRWNIVSHTMHSPALISLSHLTTDPKIIITARLWALLFCMWASTTELCRSQQGNSLLLYSHKCWDKDSNRRKSRLRIHGTKPPYEILSTTMTAWLWLYFIQKKTIWKPCYSLTRTSPSVCCSAERAQDTLTLLSFSSFVWPRPEQGDHRKILDSWKDAPTWTRSWAAANTPRATKCNCFLWKQRLRGDLMHVWAYTQQPEELLSLIR